MIDLVGKMDAELLVEQANATTTIPDKDYSEGIGNLLSWIITGIDTFGYVVITTDDVRDDQLPLWIQEQFKYQDKEKR